MTREERIIGTFVELADSIVDDFDVVEFLHRLTIRAAELLDCQEAGILLADSGGSLRVMASSSEEGAALELLQSQNGEGPCWDAHHEGRLVSSQDLEIDGGRWPGFSPTALRSGFRSVQAVPMRARGETIGALNLFRSETGPIAAQDVPLAQGMADMAAISLLRERSAREARTVVTQLHGALRSRVVIEQAKGVLAERAQIDIASAFARMRDHARSTHQRLGDVARDLVEGRVAPELLARTPDRQS